MASVVKGYPCAYQVLGYLCYKRQCSYHEIIDEFDAYLGEYVYDKIWLETSAKDQAVLAELAQSQNGKVAEIRELTDLSSGEMSVYRDRLIKKGILSTPRHGYLDFTLHRFAEYVARKPLV